MSRKLKSILIRNGHIFSASDDYFADILVVDGKIEHVGKGLSNQYSADEVIDADGLYVFPGGIDAHTHMELPFMGTYSADDFETGTLAGLHGGTTSIVDFAIQSKGASLKDCLQEWHKKAKGKAVADYGFHIAVTDYNEDVRKEIATTIDGGVTSFKAFMAYKGALMVDDQQLLLLMDETKKHGGLISVHAENGDIIDLLIKKFQKEGKAEPKYHPLAHPPEAEGEAVGRASDLAYLNKSHVYIVHTSTENAMERVQRALGRNQQVLVETCPQYLLLDDSCYEKPDFQGAMYVMSPPIRKIKDQDALWSGLQAGTIQVVGTDHCPFNFKGQKDMGRDDFSKIPNGGPGIENRLELIFSEGVRKNRISMYRFVEVCCTNPARIFGMKNKGSISVGKDADLVLFDPNEEHMISRDTHHHNVDNSIFEGWKVTGRVKTVVSGGRLAIKNGKAFDVKKGDGKFIKRYPFVPRY